MSINSLLTESTNKSWANLYVNKLQTNELIVKNDMTIDGDSTYSGDTIYNGDSTYDGDVLIKGKLTLDNSNNASGFAIDVYDATIRTNNFIEANALLTEDLDVYGSVGHSMLFETTNSPGDTYAIKIADAKDFETNGKIIAPSIQFDLSGQALEEFQYHNDTVTFFQYDNASFGDIDIDYTASKIGQNGDENIVNIIFNFSGDFSYNPSHVFTSELLSSPIEGNFRPKSGNNLKVLTVVNDTAGRSIGIAELRSDGILAIYKDINETAFSSGGNSTTGVGPIADISFTFKIKS